MRGSLSFNLYPFMNIFVSFFSKENKEMTNDGQTLEMVNFVFVKPWLPSQFFGSTKLSKINNIFECDTFWMWQWSGWDICPPPIGRQGWCGWSGCLGRFPLPPSPQVRSSWHCSHGQGGSSLNRRGPQSRVPSSCAPCRDLQTGSRNMYTSHFI